MRETWSWYVTTDGIVTQFKEPKASVRQYAKTLLQALPRAYGAVFIVPMICLVLAVFISFSWHFSWRESLEKTGTVLWQYGPWIILAFMAYTLGHIGLYCVPKTVSLREKGVVKFDALSSPIRKADIVFVELMGVPGTEDLIRAIVHGSEERTLTYYLSLSNDLVANIAYFEQQDIRIQYQPDTSTAL